MQCNKCGAQADEMLQQCGFCLIVLCPDCLQVHDYVEPPCCQQAWAWDRHIRREVATA